MADEAMIRKAAREFLNDLASAYPELTRESYVLSYAPKPPVSRPKVQPDKAKSVSHGRRVIAVPDSVLDLSRSRLGCGVRINVDPHRKGRSMAAEIVRLCVDDSRARKDLSPSSDFVKVLEVTPNRGKLSAKIGYVPHSARLLWFHRGRSSRTGVAFSSPHFSRALSGRCLGRASINTGKTSSVVEVIVPSSDTSVSYEKTIDFVPAVGKQIRDMRKDAHLTQEKLAEKLNISKYSVSRHEHGKSLTLDLLPEYAKAFGTEPRDLLPSIGHDEPSQPEKNADEPSQYEKEVYDKILTQILAYMEKTGFTFPDIMEILESAGNMIKHISAKGKENK